MWFIAGLFVLLAIPVSAYGVQAHMEHYCVPKLQKHVIRILWMPCVYGLACWLALRFKARAQRRVAQLRRRCADVARSGVRHAPRPFADALFLLRTPGSLHLL